MSGIVVVGAGQAGSSCVAKLRALVIEAMNRPKKRRATRPSKASIRRRLDAKKQRAQLKQTRKPPKREE